MIELPLLKEMKQLIPEGERSDFVNAALGKAFREFSRQKGMDLLKEWRKGTALKLTDAEISKLRNYGRE